MTQVQPEPGAGARAEYERRRAARLRRDPHSEAPQHETAWLVGADGEAAVGAALNREARRLGGVAVLHDLALPGKRSNIDHLVIGPAGVTVVDSKAYSWSKVGDGDVDGVRRQINRVHSALAAQGRDDVRTDGGLCFSRAKVTDRAMWRARTAGLHAGNVDSVVRLAMRGGRHDVDDVMVLTALLEAAFVVSGGRVLPVEPSKAPAPLPRRRISRRRRSRRGKLVTAALAIPAVLAALVAVAVLLAPAARIATTLTPTELRSHRATYRLIAERRAHGHVRGPRAIPGAASYTYVYRRGRRCRVVLTVERSRAHNPLGAAAVASTGCRRR